MPPLTIPQFLLPRGVPSARTLIALNTLRQTQTSPASPQSTSRCTYATSTKDNSSKARVLSQPDKFRPPSHPSRRVLPTRNGKPITSPGPMNYPGPKLSEKEKEERESRQYPHMFPPEGTVMHRFLTSRWIHIWIAMSILTTLATFTFTTNFKQSSPFAHLLPPWSGLLSSPIGTISQALSVYRMHVQHSSMQAREKRLQRVEDAEKRRQYRVAHGLEEETEAEKEKEVGGKEGPATAAVDDQSPVAVDVDGANANAGGRDGEFVDWEGKKRPVKKWLGIW